MDERVDWKAAEESPEFKKLVKKQRAFVLPATAFFLGYYMLFILLAGYAPDFMVSSIYEGFTVGYLLALTQFVMVWVLAWAYVRSGPPSAPRRRPTSGPRAVASPARRTAWP